MLPPPPFLLVCLPLLLLLVLLILFFVLFHIFISFSLSPYPLSLSLNHPFSTISYFYPFLCLCPQRVQEALCVRVVRPSVSTPHPPGPHFIELVINYNFFFKIFSLYSKSSELRNNNLPFNDNYHGNSAS